MDSNHRLKAPDGWKPPGTFVCSHAAITIPIVNIKVKCGSEAKNEHLCFGTPIHLYPDPFPDQFWTKVVTGWKKNPSQDCLKKRKKKKKGGSKGTVSKNPKTQVPWAPPLDPPLCQAAWRIGKLMNHPYKKFSLLDFLALFLYGTWLWFSKKKKIFFWLFWYFFNI